MPRQAAHKPPGGCRKRPRGPESRARPSVGRKAIPKLPGAVARAQGPAAVESGSPRAKHRLGQDASAGGWKPKRRRPPAVAELCRAQSKASPPDGRDAVARSPMAVRAEGRSGRRGCQCSDGHGHGRSGIRGPCGQHGLQGGDGGLDGFGRLTFGLALDRRPGRPAAARRAGRRGRRRCGAGSARPSQGAAQPQRTR